MNNITDDLVEVDQLDTEISAHGVTEGLGVTTDGIICEIIVHFF